MHYARLDSFLRSFRFRVIAMMVGIVLVIMLISSALESAIVRRSIYEDFDRQLHAEAGEAVFVIHACFPNGLVGAWSESAEFDKAKRELDLRAKSRGTLGWFIHVFDDASKPIFRSDSPLTKEQEVPFLPAGKTTIHEAGKLRWIQVPFPDPSSVRLWIQIGRSLEFLTEDTDLLNYTLLLRGLFGVVLAPIAGFFLARQVLGPLNAIVSTASRLQPQHLSERLPVRGVHDELDQVSDTINKALDRIADYIEKNQAFVANAAHELRSPLAAIRSSVEVALNRPRTNEEYCTLMTELVDEVDRLSSMVNRLLVLAEGDAGLISAGPNQRGRLDKVVREAVDMFEAVAEAQGVQLKTNEFPLIEVPGDESHLRHLVRNLIDNAIKFSAPSTEVMVELHADPATKTATFRVKDQGVGIPPEDLPRLFERFFRGDKSRRHEGRQRGSGLGLSICHAIATALHGSIHVESAAGSGSTFTVRLPFV